MKKDLILLAILAGVSSNINANILVDFEGLGGASLPPEYKGFTWDGTWTLATETIGAKVNTYVAPTGTVTIQRSDSLSFNFDYAYFATAGTGDANVTIVGTQGGKFVKSVEFTLQTDWTQYFLNGTPPIMEGVDKLEFTGVNWRMDNFMDIAIPESSTMIAGALLLLPFGLSTLRLLRKNMSS